MRFLFAYHLHTPTNTLPSILRQLLAEHYLLLPLRLTLFDFPPLLLMATESLITEFDMKETYKDDKDEKKFATGLLCKKKHKQSIFQELFFDIVCSIVLSFKKLSWRPSRV